MTHRIKILIAEFIPAFNKGELAILNGILESFKFLGDVEVFVFSFYPDIDKVRYPRKVKLVDINHSLFLRDLPFKKSKTYVQFATLFAVIQHLTFIFLFFFLRRNVLKIMRKPLWKTYWECDTYIICTNEVDCVNGSTLKFSPLYVCWLAKMLKKPIVFYANGTNPHTSEVWIWRFHSRKLWRILAKYLLSVVDLITVREAHTLRFFKGIIGDKRPFYLTADPAFLLPSVDETIVNKIMLNERITKNSNGLLIGVDVSYGALLFSFKDKFLEPYRKYKLAVKELANLLDKLIDKYNATIIFIPHSIEPYDYLDDRKVAWDIYSFMAHKSEVRLIENEYSAEELKGLMGKLDLFISSRVHAAIGAVSMGTPVLILSHPFDERPHYILGDMCNLSRWIYNVENLNADKLFSLTEEVISSTDKVRADLLIRVSRVRKRAMLNGKLLKCLIDDFYRSKDRI